MSIKSVIAAALLVPFFALNGAGHAEGVLYQGGPKSPISKRSPVQTFEADKPYAQYVPAARAVANKHIYQGGPKTTVPHQQ